MKKVEKGILKVASKVVLKTVQREANSACFFLGYQPKAPENLKKLRKF